MDATVRQLLDERARALARPVEAPRTGDVELVVFALADEVYALESHYVVEVLRLSSLAFLPGATPPVLGLTTWRGGLLTVLDLRPLLGLATASLNDLGRVIVMGETRAAFGVLADAVRGLVRLEASAIDRSADKAAKAPEYVRGVTGEGCVVLDAEQLLRGFA
jgi:purine-binding chemotaxis protein CheW